MADHKYVFDSNLRNCQKNFVSVSLLCLVSMTLIGSNTKVIIHNVNVTQALLPMLQLLQYNCIFHKIDKHQATQVIQKKGNHPTSYLYLFSGICKNLGERINSKNLQT